MQITLNKLANNIVHDRTGTHWLRKHYKNFKNIGSFVVKQADLKVCDFDLDKKFQM